MLRYAFPIAETSFDPAQITDLYSRTVAAGIFDAPLELRLHGAAGRLRPQHRRGDARGLGRLPQLHVPHQARHPLRRRPGLQGQEARADRRRLRLFDQAPLRPALEERQPLPARERQDPRPVASCASRRSTTRQPFDYDTRGRGPARAGPLHASQMRLAEPSPRFLYNFADGSLHRRAGARGGRVLRRQDRRAPGGHRAVPAGAVEAQLAHRAREQPELPRGAVRRAAAGRRRAAAGHRARSSRAGACRSSTRCRSR